MTALTLLLSGCAALPVPVQIASWALDGISVIATQKSITDHGISIVADQDCAVWRGLTDGQLCRVHQDDSIESEVLTALAPISHHPTNMTSSVITPSMIIDEETTSPMLSNLYLDII